MLNYNNAAYSELFGKVEDNIFLASSKCMGQCTGCMCNCRCACSIGIISDIEWEVF